MISGSTISACSEGKAVNLAEEGFRVAALVWESIIWVAFLSVFKGFSVEIMEFSSKYPG